MTNDVKRFTLRIPVHLFEKLKNEGQKMDISISAVVKIILNNHFNTK